MRVNNNVTASVHFFFETKKKIKYDKKNINTEKKKYINTDRI